MSNDGTMYHDESRLLKIEKWARRLAWLILVIFLVNFVSLIAKLVTLLINPDYIYSTSAFLFQIRQSASWQTGNVPFAILYFIFENLRPVLTSFFYYLMLLGTAYFIRYLLALKHNLQNAQP